MQQGITPMKDVDEFDPNVDPAGNEGLGRKQDETDGPRDEDLPLPPDVEDREPIEEPDVDPPQVRDPRGEPPMIV